jgi:tetratricopeptide (TPR) repeat protein
VHFYCGRQSDGVARVEAFLDRLEGRNPPAGMARLQMYHLLNTYLAQRASLAEIVPLSEQAAALAQAEGDSGSYVGAEAIRTMALRTLGRVEEAVQIADAVVPLAEEGGDETSLGALGMLAETYHFTGRFDQARRQLERNRATYERRGNSDGVAQCWAHIGETYVGEGDWQQARASYEKAMQIRDPESHSWLAVFPLIWFGELAVSEGKWTEAERLLDDAMTLARANQDGQWLWRVHEQMIEQALLRGQVEEAFEFHQRLVADPDQAPKLTTFPSPALTKAYLAAGDVNKTDELIERGIQFLGEDALDAWVWVWIAMRARVLAARERWDESEDAFLDAITRARRTRIVLCEAQVLQWHGEMLAAHGEVDRARQRLQEARQIYARVGAAPYLAQTDAALERLGR